VALEYLGYEANPGVGNFIYPWWCKIRGRKEEEERRGEKEQRGRRTRR
jgi:hypothetical protein